MWWIDQTTGYDEQTVLRGSALANSPQFIPSSLANSGRYVESIGGWEPRSGRPKQHLQPIIQLNQIQLRIQHVEQNANAKDMPNIRVVLKTGDVPNSWMVRENPTETWMIL